MVIFSDRICRRLYPPHPKCCKATYEAAYPNFYIFKPCSITWFLTGDGCAARLLRSSSYLTFNTACSILKRVSSRASSSLSSRFSSSLHYERLKSEAFIWVQYSRMLRSRCLHYSGFKQNQWSKGTSIWAHEFGCYDVMLSLGAKSIHCTEFQSCIPSYDSPSECNRHNVAITEVSMGSI